MNQVLALSPSVGAIAVVLVGPALVLAGLLAWGYRRSRSRRLRRRRVLRPWSINAPSGKGVRGGPFSALLRSGAWLVQPGPVRWRAFGGALGGACLGGLAGGPVAAMVGGVYAALAVRVVSRQRSARQTLREHRRRLDELCGLAADLRAGIPASVAIGRLSALRHSPDTTGGPLQDGSDRISALLQAAGRIAERTGAPLADLVERIEADARARDRGLAAARAQAAGGQATAWLLAGLPVGGIALGYGIGVDPLEVLLRTPIGAGCAVAAVALQLAGLAWSDRLGSAFDRVD